MKSRSSHPAIRKAFADADLWLAAMQDQMRPLGLTQMYHLGMGDKKLLIAAGEFHLLRLTCTRRQTALTLDATSVERVSEVLSSNCARSMMGARIVLNKWRDFFAELTGHGAGRDARFEIAWRDV